MAAVSFLGMSANVERTTGTVSASATYAAWAAELGVSSSGSEIAMDNTNPPSLISLPVPPFSGSALKAATLSPDGGLGLYAKWLPGTGPNISAAPLDSTIVTPMYFFEGRVPNLLLTFHPQVDCLLENSKVRRSGNVTIMTGHIRAQGSPSSNPLDFAIRIDGTGSLRLVLSGTTATESCYLFFLNLFTPIWRDTVAAGQIAVIDITSLAYTPTDPPVVSTLGPAVSNTLGQTPSFPGARAEHRLQGQRDFNLGGMGRVRGTIKIDGTPNDIPARRRVRLIRERDGMVVQEQWSNAATGAYDFQYVETAQLYTVLSYDHLAQFRAVVADRLAPEMMP